MITGNYMKKVAVQHYVEYTTGKKANIKLPVYELPEHGISEFWSTNDLKSIMPKDMFRKMECKVTTHMVGIK